MLIVVRIKKYNDAILDSLLSVSLGNRNFFVMIPFHYNNQMLGEWFV